MTVESPTAPAPTTDTLPKASLCKTDEVTDALSYSLSSVLAVRKEDPPAVAADFLVRSGRAGSESESRMRLRLARVSAGGASISLSSSSSSSWMRVEGVMGEAEGRGRPIEPVDSPLE